MAGYKVCKELFILYKFLRIPPLMFVHYAQPSISRPYAGWKLEIPVSKLDRVRANGVVDQIKIRDVVFAGIHDPYLGIFAISVPFRSPYIANNIVRVVGNLHVIPIDFQ